MAARYDWYYEQLVLEDELDSAFDALEVSDRALSSDWAMCRDDSNEAEFGGIFWGLTASHVSGLDMAVADGAGYDGDGRRVALSTLAGSLIVTPSYTGSTAAGAGGVPSGGTSTSPSDGYERWVTIFIVYDRLMSDPRYDGYNVLVYFNRAESFHFEVSMGTQKTIGSLLVSDKPARQDGKLLICDARIKNVSGTVTYVTDSTSNDRREVFFNVTASGSPGKTIKGENIRVALKSMLQLYNDHVGGTADKHPASDLTYAGGQTWADGTGGYVGSATTVQNAIDAIVADLKPTVSVAGAERIGAKAQAGALATPTMSAVSLSAGTLESQLTTILTALNGRVFRGGDSGIGGALSPASDGTALGTDSHSWDAYVRDFKCKGAVKSNFVPGTTEWYDLGTSSLRWLFLYILEIDCSGYIGCEDFYCADSGASNYWGVYADMFVNGHTNFQGDYVSVKPSSGNDGLRLETTGTVMDGGWLAYITCKAASYAKWLQIDKFGAVEYGPLFMDNFSEAYMTSPTSTLADHLSKYKWVGGSGFSTYYFSAEGTSEKKCISLTGGASETGPKSIYIQASGWWDVGGLHGLMTKFTMGCTYAGIPVGNEYIRAGFIGTWFGLEATIRIGPTGAWGFFKAASSGAISWGAVNLIGGTPVASTPYTFRIVVLANNVVWVQGPAGYEMLYPASGTINVSEACQFEFSYDCLSGTASGRGGNLYDVWVNEQNLRGLD